MQALAISIPINRAPSAMTLASLCWRASRAESGSATWAQRTVIAIGGDRNPDPAPAQRHAELGLAARDGIGQDVAIVGVVDTGLAVGAQIAHLMPAIAKPCGDFVLHGNSSMIGCNGEAHEGYCSTTVYMITFAPM